MTILKLVTVILFICVHQIFAMLPLKDIQYKIIKKSSEMKLVSTNQTITFLNLPDVRQSQTYTCGPSALTSILMFFGIQKREGTIAELAHTTINGTTPQNLLNVVVQLGLAAQWRQQLTIADLQDFIGKKIPVMVAIQAWRQDTIVPWQDRWDDGHYVVVIGFDKENIYLEDPSMLGSIGIIPKDEFVHRWHDADQYGRRYFGLGLIVNGSRVDIPVVKKLE